MREGGHSHQEPLSRALPWTVRVPAMPSHLHALGQPAHALQVQASGLQPRHAQVRGRAGGRGRGRGRGWRSRASRSSCAAAVVREPPGRGLRLIVRVPAPARPRRPRWSPRPRRPLNARGRDPIERSPI